MTGWKTYVGMVLVIIAEAGELLKPEWAPVWKAIEAVGLALGAVGVTHKVVREVRAA